MIRGAPRLQNVGEKVHLVTVAVERDGTTAQSRIANGTTFNLTNTPSFYFLSAENTRCPNEIYRFLECAPIGGKQRRKHRLRPKETAKLS